MKVVGRGDTTVVDAYLSPILGRYVDQVARAIGDVRLMFMQSNGGLVDAQMFRGKDAILSGPAGGIVGAVRVSALAGFEKIITFDMGGTSTDVAHYAGALERSFESEVAGVRMRAPMMAIHTVAAGGGSILTFDGARFRVGPESAGANPGPACYRKGGPLTVTDANLMVGKLQPRFFPKVFGPDADQPPDIEVVHEKFAALAAEVGRATGVARTPEQIAHGCLAIAVDNMANAIKRISIERGHDIGGYVLCCFGGAAGQHACLVADLLGLERILVHPLASVLSAYGMGLADVRALRQRAIEATLDAALMPRLAETIEELGAEGRAELEQQGVATDRISTEPRIHIRYSGTDTPLEIAHGSLDALRRAFEAEHRARYGFVVEGRPLVVEQVTVEAIGRMAEIGEPEQAIVARPDAGAGAAGRRGRDDDRSRPASAARELGDAGVRARRPAPGRRDQGPGDHRRAHHHRGGRARLAGGAHRARSPAAAPRRAARQAGRDRHALRSDHARDLQQPVHGDRRADGRDAAEHRLLGQHEGAPGLLLRRVRSGRHADRECAAHAGASGLDGRERAHDPAPARRQPAAGRRLRAEQPLQRRHAPARRHRGRCRCSAPTGGCCS